MADYTIPDWKRVALLTIDVQKDFTPIPGTMEAVPKIQQLVQAFRQVNRPIIHVVRIYLPDGSNVDLCRHQEIEGGKQVAIIGSDGAELVDELKPSSQTQLDSESLLKGRFQSIGHNEWFMYKPRWGAFYQTSLEKHLHEHQINTLVICGCNFPNCPRATIYEASERDFRVILIVDATSVIYERGLQELENIGVKLLTTKECLFQSLIGTHTQQVPKL